MWKSPKGTSTIWLDELSPKAKQPTLFSPRLLCVLCVSAVREFDIRHFNRRGAEYAEEAQRKLPDPMSLKESSDELNPSEIVPEAIGHEPLKRSPADYLALTIATVGVGYLPLAPGTWGSVVGVGIYLLLRYTAINLGHTTFLFLESASIIIITISGIWAASQTERITGRKDPGKVVVDEVAGQLISLLPLTLVPSWLSWKPWVIVSFILFRFFDIVKPYPARQMERLHGGLGIMCDDLVAGIYAAVVVLVAIGVLSAI